MDDHVKVFFQCPIDAANGEIHVMGSAKDFIAFTSWAEEQRWIDERLRLNVFLKALLFPSDDAKTLHDKDKNELREIRLITDMKPFSTLIMTYANKTILWQPHAPMAILIEDEYLSAMHESLFQYLWKQHAR